MSDETTDGFTILNSVVSEDDIANLESMVDSAGWRVFQRILAETAEGLLAGLAYVDFAKQQKEAHSMQAQYTLLDGFAPMRSNGNQCAFADSVHETANHIRESAKKS